MRKAGRKARQVHTWGGAGEAGFWEGTEDERGGKLTRRRVGMKQREGKGRKEGKGGRERGKIGKRRGSDT